MAYQYWTTDLRTGQVLADWLPLRVSSFSRTLGGVGELSGAVDLRVSAVQNAAHLAALEPRRSVLWVGEDGFPVWGGIVWDWPHTSVLDYTLPIRAATVESLFDRREIRWDHTYTNVDAFDIARDIVTSVTSGWPGKEIHNLLLPEGLAGVTRTITHLGADAKKALLALQDAAADADFEFTFEPGLSSGAGAFHLRLGYPMLGGGPGAAGIVLQMPGNVVDYSWPRTGGASVNSLTVTATATGLEGTQAVWRTNRTDADDIGFGFPVLEDSAQYSGAVVYELSQVQAYADTLLRRRRSTATVPTVKVGGPHAPLLRELTLGSYLWLLASSPLHPADPATGAPGLRRTARLIGWSATPPAEGQEQSVDLHLAEVD